jgi:hypothetical protein
MYHLFDGYNTPNGSHTAAFCSNRQHFLYARRRGRKPPPRKSNTIGAEKFRAFDKFSASIQIRTHSLS